MKRLFLLLSSILLACTGGAPDDVLLLLGSAPGDEVLLERRLHFACFADFEGQDPFEVLQRQTPAAGGAYAFEVYRETTRPGGEHACFRIREPGSTRAELRAQLYEGDAHLPPLQRWDDPPVLIEGAWTAPTVPLLPDANLSTAHLVEWQVDGASGPVWREEAKGAWHGTPELREDFPGAAVRVRARARPGGADVERHPPHRDQPPRCVHRVGAQPPARGREPMSAERHLTSEELDLLELGALDAGERRFAEQHLASCTRCAELRTELRADTAHFRQFVMPRTMDRATAARPARAPWLRWASLAGGVAVVAVALLVARPLIAGRSDDGYVGVRGDPTLKVVAARGTSQTELSADTVLTAGDRLRFIVDPVQPGYVLVLSRDPAGAWSVYAPFGGERSVQVPAGSTTLQDTVELDATTGREHLVAVFSDAPLASKDVVAALSSGGWPPASRPHVEGARAVQVVAFEKR